MSRSLGRVERLRQLETRLVTKPYTRAELAAHFGVDDSTIWRDLRDLGTNGGVTIQEQAGRFWIDRQDYLSSVRLSQAEAMVLYLAMRHQARRLTHVPPAMINAMVKLARSLRDPLSERLADLATSLDSSEAAQGDHAGVWESLIRGWSEGITLRLSYQKFDADAPRVYEFQPYFFEPALLSEGVYVVGHSLSHGGIRTFKVERIVEARLTTLPFERPTDLDIDALLRHAWGIWYGTETRTVRLHFADPSVARRVTETRWHPSQQIEPLPGGGIIWSVQVSGTVELLPWIRGWGPDVEVLEPPDLRQRIADEMRRAASLYEKEHT